MYEAYFDDSGTNRQSPVAIAACYVSTKRGWDTFVEQWNLASYEEGFDAFHMSEFVAPREHGHKPWCDWDNPRKDRVFDRLARIVNDNKRIGVAVAVPKAAYDLVPEKIRTHYGSEHYTFAIRICLIEIYLWRSACRIALPVRYVFDREEPRTSKYAEVTHLFESMHPTYREMFGLEGKGYSFQDKRILKPLQAADILAWQAHNYIPRLDFKDETQEDVNTKMHPNFGKLRRGQELTIRFLTPSTIDEWVERLLKFEAEHGVIC